MTLLAGADLLGMPLLGDYLDDLSSLAIPRKSSNSQLSVRAIMPYRTNADLPPPARSHLPPHAQDIYREAFNHAFSSHAGDERQEEIAHRTAWAAVKRS